MSDDKQEPAGRPSQNDITTIVNSKAAEKLADAVKGLVQLPHNVLDYIVGPKRIAAVNAARAEGPLVEARAQAEVERLRAETADFVLDREMKRTLNRRAILVEANKALPPPDENMSDERISPDFVHSFFDEFDGISDPEVHKIVGRLLAGEVVRPGTFPRRTMRVLRDLESSDFALFTSMCTYAWHIGDFCPLIFEPNGAIYTKNGLNFRNLSHLEALGLVTFGQIGGFSRQRLPPKFTVSYGNILVSLELAKGQDNLDLGHALLTDAGQRLVRLTNAPLVLLCH